MEHECDAEDLVLGVGLSFYTPLDGLAGHSVKFVPEA
jgi:hypothetical protein